VVSACLAATVGPDRAHLSKFPCFAEPEGKLRAYFDAASKGWEYPWYGTGVNPPVGSPEFGAYVRLLEWYGGEIALCPLAHDDFLRSFGTGCAAISDFAACVSDWPAVVAGPSERERADPAFVAQISFKASVARRALPAGHPAQDGILAYFRALDSEYGSRRVFDGVSTPSAVAARVRGVARLIDWDRPSVDAPGYNVFNEGDVFVCAKPIMRYMSYVVRSGAVVTVNPHHVSHDAIVLAELGKPCALGVAEAPAVLFDGDVVGVDPAAARVTVVRRFYETA